MYTNQDLKKLFEKGYDIVHDSEQFDLFVDGKICE